MKESPNGRKSFPVNVVAMRIDWILDTKKPEGRKFLKAILQSNNLDLYEVESLQMLIEFLYQMFKNVVLTIQMPLFVLQLITFYWLMALNEEFIENWVNQE